jgi:hypothetical protein
VYTRVEQAVLQSARVAAKTAVVHETTAHNRTMKMGTCEEPVGHFQEREIAERVRNHSLTVVAR